MAGLFDGIATTKVSLNRYIRSGHYLARIDNVKLTKNRDGNDLIAIEMTCLACLSGPQEAVPLKGEAHHAPGEAMAEVISKSGSKDMFLPRFKAFLMSVLKAADAEITPELCAAVTGEQQPLKGLVVDLFGTNIKTQKKQVDLVRVEWRGQCPVARLRTQVPAEKLAALITEPELVALEQRQKAAGIV
jgi:hypothetical protein